MKQQLQQSQSEVKDMGRRMIETQLKNVDLEQDISILRKKFTELLRICSSKAKD